MGYTNRKASLERKIALLMGEREDKANQVERAEREYARVPHLRERIGRIGTLIFYCEEIMRDDNPAWTPHNIKAQKPHAHKIPVPLGQAIKSALQVLRDNNRRMTVREISIEVLAREGVDGPTNETIQKVSNNIGNQFRKGNRPYLKSDGQWPAHWWIDDSDATGPA